MNVTIYLLVVSFGMKGFYGVSIQATLPISKLQISKAPHLF
jgi:hypothetical protein